MTWVVYAIFVFICSTALYLTLRKLSFFKLDDEIKNLFLFLPAAISLFIYASFNKQSLFINNREILSLIIASIFIWLGNVSILRSLKISPNPGYPVLIGKSYVLITALLSPILFGSILIVKSVGLILLILFFISLIIIDKTKKQNIKRPNWIFPALLGFLFWEIMSLSLISLKRPGLSSGVIIMYLSLFSSVIISLEMIIKKISLFSAKKHTVWLLVLGMIGLFFNLFMITGYKLAPNPGYMDAVNASSVAAITLFSALIFKDEITLKKGIGIAGVIICLILLLF